MKRKRDAAPHADLASAYVSLRDMVAARSRDLEVLGAESAAAGRPDLEARIARAIRNNNAFIKDSLAQFEARVHAIVDALVAMRTDVARK